MERRNPATAIIVGLVGLALVLLAGFLRGIQADTARTRVTFLTAEDIAAEEEETARQAAKETARDAARARHAARDTVVTAGRAQRAEERRARRRNAR